MAEESQVTGESRAGFFIRLAFAILAGAVFLYAGIAKVSDPLKFASDISNYRILPWALGVRFAFYLPWLEIAVGLALIFQRLFLGALAIAISLVLVFLAATIWARVQGINVACGCFGSASSNLTLTWHLVIDLGLLAILVGLALARKQRRVSL